MAFLILYPGETGELVSLQECLRQLHEEARAAQQREAATRAENSSSPTERIDWAKAREAASKAGAALEAESPGAFRMLEEAAAHARVPQMLGEYVPSPEIEGISVRFRVLSEEQKQRMLSRVIRAHRSYLASLEAKDEDAQSLTLPEVNAARAAFVLAVVAEVRGLESRKGPIASLDSESIEAVRLSGLLAPLYECAVAFQVLDPKKALRFGLPVGSSSSASPAASVPTTDGLNGDVTAGLSGEMARQPILLGPDSSLTPVPAVT